MANTRTRTGTNTRTSPEPAANPTRADALGRIAARVSGRRDVAGLFDDIIDETFALFGADRIAAFLRSMERASPVLLRVG